MSGEENKKRISREDLYEAIGNVEEDLLARAEGESDRGSGTLSGMDGQRQRSAVKPDSVPDPLSDSETTGAERLGSVPELVEGPVSTTRRRNRSLMRYLPIAAAAVLLLGITLLWNATGRMGRDGASSTGMAPAAEQAAIMEFDEDVAEEAEEEMIASGPSTSSGTDAKEAVMEEATEEGFAEEATKEEVAEEAAEEAVPELVEGPAEAAGSGELTSAEESGAAFESADTDRAEGTVTNSTADTEQIAAESTEASGAKNAAAKDTEETMRIRVSDGTHTIEYLLNDSAPARSLYANLPMEVSVENYGSNEKIFYPPVTLDKSGGIEGSGGAGTIALFSPWGNVVLYYGDFSSYPGLYLLGDAVSGADEIRSLSGTITVEALE